jgi:hypothetical protein
MNSYNILTIFTAASSLFAITMLADIVDAKHKIGPHRQHLVTKQAGGNCPLRRVAGGDLADCHGWRLREGGWDSTCFNLDYLPSQFACSSRSGGY